MIRYLPGAQPFSDADMREIAACCGFFKFHVGPGYYTSNHDLAARQNSKGMWVLTTDGRADYDTKFQAG